MMVTIDYHAQRLTYIWSPAQLVECVLANHGTQICSSTAEADVKHAARNTEPQAVTAAESQPI
jgi:hypothetical protein